MPLTAGGKAPYAPPATVIEVIRRYRERGLTTPFTKEVLERAGIAETLSQRTMQALKLLELADSEGNPTKEFEAAIRAPAADFQERMSNIILHSYSEVFSFADPAEDTYERVRDAFRSYNPRAQQDRMVTLYLGLLEFVGVNVSAANASRKTPGPRPASNGQPKVKGGRTTSGRPSSSGTGQRGTKAIASGRDPRDAALVAWFDSRPAPSEPWPKVERDAFMITLRAIIDGIYAEVATEPAEGDSG